ncbi:restriction endonuclease subunit S [Belliella sp. R4-6]|uniref:Restriction endonuclease subunit S n=1 Tax=Belliella alkalica TaxID=1730871 RepID=A0ABS9V6P0_9BACT|nr:restriction endonuclease subunit S [Belliella alkalica]MCH7412085.1 restriction endonuclease subunit S [Belliella alkalica]
MEKVSPKLRFSNFSDVWESQKVKKFYKLISGQHLGPSEYFNNPSNPRSLPYFTGPSDFTNDRLKLTKWTNKQKNTAIGSDILFTVKGSGVGTMMFLHLQEIAIGRQLMAIRGENGNTNFLFQRLMPLQRNFVALASGNMIPGLSRGDILNTIISFPSLPEQQKIASFLSSVDERIELLEQKKEKLEAYKKGVMQQIFSQQIRFKQDDGSEFPDWEERKLGEVVKVFSGGTPKSSDPDLYGGDIPFIRSGEINASATELTLTEKGLKNSSAKMVEKGDLLLAIYGATSGEAGISKINGAINQAILCIRWAGENMFLLNWLKLNKNALTQKYLQGGQGNLSGEIVKSFELNIPSREEQIKIAAFLKSIDENLETLDSQIQGLRIWKKGLLQQMFV